MTSKIKTKIEKILTHLKQIFRQITFIFLKFFVMRLLNYVKHVLSPIIPFFNFPKLENGKEGVFVKRQNIMHQDEISPKMMSEEISLTKYRGLEF